MTYKTLWIDLWKKVFEHAELASFAAIIELIDLVNEEGLRMCSSTYAALDRNCTARTTVPPLLADLSVLVVVHDLASYQTYRLRANPEPTQIGPSGSIRTWSIMIEPVTNTE